MLIKGPTEDNLSSITLYKVIYSMPFTHTHTHTHTRGQHWRNSRQEEDVSKINTGTVHGPG